MKRQIALLFVFSLLLVPRAFPFGQNKIVYDTFKWNVDHSTLDGWQWAVGGGRRSTDNRRLTTANRPMEVQ